MSGHIFECFSLLSLRSSFDWIFYFEFIFFLFWLQPPFVVITTIYAKTFSMFIATTLYWYKYFRCSSYFSHFLSLSLSLALTPSVWHTSTHPQHLFRKCANVEQPQKRFLVFHCLRFSSRTANDELCTIYDILCEDQPNAQTGSLTIYSHTSMDVIITIWVYRCVWLVLSVYMACPSLHFMSASFCSTSHPPKTHLQLPRNMSNAEK